MAATPVARWREALARMRDSCSTPPSADDAVPREHARQETPARFRAATDAAVPRVHAPQETPARFRAAVDALREQRARFRAAIDAYAKDPADRSPIAGAAAIMSDVYDLFRRHSPHALPALYVGLCAPDGSAIVSPPSPVEEALRVVLGPVFQREARAFYRFPTTLGTGGKVLLTGVKGIGKTTVLYMAEIVATLLCDRCLVVYLNYETETNPQPRLPSVAVCAAARARYPDWPASDASREEDMAWAGIELSRRGVWLLLLVDELQEVYKEECANAGARIVRQLLVVAKEHSNNFAIVSGSSSSVQRLAFQQDDICQQRSWVRNYPNLNHTVFVPMPMLPIRNRDHFGAVVRRDPALVTLAAARGGEDALFARTGGVGRLLNSIANAGWGDDKTVFHEYETEAAKDGAFSLIVSYFQHRTGTAPSVATSRPTVSYKEIEAMAKDAGESAKAVDLIDSFIDRGLLCRAAYVHSYELLLPDALRHLAELHQEPDKPSFKTKTAFQAVFMDWAKHGGSAGSYCEPQVRQWLCENRPDLVPPFDSRYVHVTQPLTMRAAKGADATQLAWPAWADCHGLYGATNETGIDGLGLQSDLNADGTSATLVTVVQIKLGALHPSNFVTPGRLLTSANTSGELLAMIGAACRGVRKIRQVWPNDYPAIQRVHLVLVTSKTLTKDAQACADKYSGQPRRYEELNAELGSPCLFAMDVIEGEEFKQLMPRNWRDAIAIDALKMS